ncbi:MAG: glycosyltransferase family 2 protein [Candidatus Acidiferrum sp.]
MIRLSICIVAQNEEHNLARLLRSVQSIADEIVVVDGGSTDGTVGIAQGFGCKLFQRPFSSHADQKNFAASVASNTWIFLLDADEELSAELAKSVSRWKQDSPQFAVYEMARLTWYLGAWIRHSRWYPDWQRRIYDREKASFSGAIHSALRYDGKIGRLHGNLLHFTIRNFAEHEAKLERYTTAIAQEMFDQGRRRWRSAMLFATPWSWIRHFVLGAGFLDGYRGALIAQMAARGVRQKFEKLGRLVEEEKLKDRSGSE